MGDKTYIWKGPPTVIEVWQEGVAEPKLIFSGHVNTGAAVPAALDDGHSLVKSWLAFALIAEASADQTAAPAEPATTEARRGRSKQENSDG